MFRLITSREEYKPRPRFRNPAATPPWAAEPFYWLDAADASNGATSWTSKEGKVFSSSTIAKTNNALNGYPVVGGYKHTWSGSGITMQDGQTIFIVGRITGWSQYQRFVSHANASQADWQTVGGFMPLVSNVSGLLNSGASGTSTDISPVAYSLNTYALWTVRRVGQAVTNAVHNAGGAWLTGDTQNLAAAVTANFTRFSIGIAPHADFSNERWQGQLAEILFYSRALSSDEYTSTRDWLLNKYAITQGSTGDQIPTDYFFHLDAADAVQGATSWTSKDGKVFTSTAISKTASRINGLPTVQSNYHYYDVGAGYTQPDGATVFLVGRTPSSAANLRFLSMAPLNTLDYFASGNNPNNYVGFVPFHTFSGPQVAALWAYKSPATISPVSFATNTNTLWTSHRVGNQLTTYSNTAAGVSAGTTQTSNNVTATFNRVAVGTQPYQLGSDGMGGEVAEVIMYNRPLTSTELANVRTYLAVKYGLAY